MSEPYVEFFEERRNPLPGGLVFDAIQPPDCILLAANPRITTDQVTGILQAAKETGNVVILELALSEMNMNRGYTGLTPHTFASRVEKAAEEAKWYAYILHGDHVTIGRKTRRASDEEIKRVKEEIDDRIDAGFTSFAIDASYLFDRRAKGVRDQLREVIRVSAEMFHHIDEKIKGRMNYGKESEVGEIGLTEYTTVEEATYFVDALKKEGVELHWLAINNGSKHGVSLDAEGNIIPQLSINLKRTVEIVDTLWAKGYRTTVAQHGITGTPFPLIATKFPKGKINKGNVGTFWMLLVWDLLQIYEPELYRRIYDWTIDKYGKEEVPGFQTFNKSSKYAIKEFFDEIERIDEDTKEAIRARSYADALMMFKAFGMRGTAKRVYDHIMKNEIEY